MPRMPWEKGGTVHAERGERKEGRGHPTAGPLQPKVCVGGAQQVTLPHWRESWGGVWKETGRGGACTLFSIPTLKSNRQVPMNNTGLSWQFFG